MSETIYGKLGGASATGNETAGVAASRISDDRHTPQGVESTATSAATIETPETDALLCPAWKSGRPVLSARYAVMSQHARGLERRLRETVIERDELLHLNGVQADNVRSERTRAEAAERELAAQQSEHKRLVKLLDVAMNGDKAAEQASLCDLIGQAKKLASVKADIAQRDATIAELRADAERLDFFLNWEHPVGEETDERGKHTFYLMDDNGEYHGKTWREAIDKARAAKGGKT